MMSTGLPVPERKPRSVSSTSDLDVGILGRGGGRSRRPLRDSSGVRPRPALDVARSGSAWPPPLNRTCTRDPFVRRVTSSRSVGSSASAHDPASWDRAKAVGHLAQGQNARLVADRRQITKSASCAGASVPAPRSGTSVCHSNRPRASRRPADCPGPPAGNATREIDLITGPLDLRCAQAVGLIQARLEFLLDRPSVTSRATGLTASTKRAPIPSSMLAPVICWQIGMAMLDALPLADVVGTNAPRDW